MPPTPRGRSGATPIASYGLLQNHVSAPGHARHVHRPEQRRHDGNSLALALRGGYDFKIGPFTTGPVAGAVLQQVRINGFTETETSGVSALSFGSQTRGSAISQLGWRGSVDLEDWQPFAELACAQRRVGQQEPHDRRVAHVDRGTVLVRRRRTRSPPTGPPPRSAPPTNSARR